MKIILILFTFSILSSMNLPFDYERLSHAIRIGIKN